MSDVPHGWMVVPIVDVLEFNKNGKPFQQGWSPQCENHPASDHTWGVLKTTAIQPGQFLDRENKQLPEGLEPRPQIEVKAGDLLMTCAGPRSRCGVVCLVERTRAKLMMSGKMYQFRPNQQAMDARFLAYFIQSRSAQLAIDRMKTGISDSGLNLTHGRFAALSVPLPPLNEQRRIVAKIEKLFSELDKGLESLAAARSQLGAYRQSLLKAAFEGKLTEDWRRGKSNLPSAAATISLARAEATNAKLKRGRRAPHREKDGVRPTVPEEWGTIALGDLNVDVFDGPFGSNLKTRDYVNSGVRVIRLENIGYGRFIESKRSYVSAEKYEELKKHTVGAGDIVVSSFVTDGIRSAIIPHSVPFAINKADCFAVRFKGEALIAEFAQRFLDSRCAYKQAEEMIHGVGRPRINTTQLKKIILPICSRPEQVEVLASLSSAYSEIDALDAELTTQMQRAAALRQSILKRAFSGQLVTQDPSDEPASVFLARIRAERDAAAQTKKRLVAA